MIKSICPICESSKIEVERRPEGDAKCLNCGFSGPYKDFLCTVSKSLLDTLEEKVYHLSRRVEELEQEIDRCKLIAERDGKDYSKLKAENKKMREALEYVALDYPKSYIHDSNYERCKKVLKEIDG